MHSGPAKRAESGRFPAVGAAQAPSDPEHLDVDPLHAEADGLFALVLDGVGEGDAQPEDYLRRCLALDPDLAAARYLLAMLLELREASAEAATEYRRALRSLEEGRARPTPFFLNHARLAVACARAVERMEGGGRPR
jgi:chemotaxis protein methyltransferase CheR